MQINLQNFENVLRKATLNYLLTYVNLEITKENVKVNLGNESGNCFIFLNLPNDIIPNINEKDSLEWNWLDPNIKVLPYIKLFDDEEVTIKNNENYINLTKNKLKSKINFCNPIDQLILKNSGPKNPNYFHTIKLDDIFMSAYDKIKKIGSQHNKIYFTVENNVLYLETTDKTISTSNTIKFKLTDLDVEMDDFYLCFDYKNIISMMKILDNPEDFQISLAYIKEADLGLAYVFNDDKSEQYYLGSKLDTA